MFEILIIFLCVGLIGLASWYVWNRSRTPINVGNSQTPPKSNTNKEDTTFLVEIDPVVGGGFAGAVNKYEITATGEVYNTNAPDYKTDAKKSLLKKIADQDVQELRQAFIESGVLDIASGDEPKYSSSSWKVTINGKEQYFYDQTSAKFDIIKLKLKKILGEDIKI